MAAEASAGDVFKQGAVGYEQVLLKHETGAAAVGEGRVGGAAVVEELHGALLGREQAGKAGEEAGFADAGGADDGDEGAAGDGEVEVAKHPTVAAPHAEVAGGDVGRGAGGAGVRGAGGVHVGGGVIKTGRGLVGGVEGGAWRWSRFS